MPKEPKIEGFKTTAIDTQDLRYQADKNYLPDKEALWPFAAAEDGWMRAHNAIRYELRTFAKALDAVSSAPLETWQRVRISVWWQGHQHHIHSHHTNEDEIFNPFLRTRINYPDKLEHDHVALVEHMEKLDGLVQEIIDEKTDSASALRAAWYEYVSMMEPHLHEEEMVGIPLMRAYFTPKEVGALVQTILKKSSKVDTGGFVHVMGSKADAKQFMRQEGIPSFVWYLVFKPARTAYRKRMASHVDSLLLGRPVVSLHRSKHEKTLSETKRLGEGGKAGAAEHGVWQQQDAENSALSGNSPAKAAQKLYDVKLTSLPGSPTRMAQRLALSPLRSNSTMYEPVREQASYPSERSTGTGA